MIIDIKACLDAKSRNLHNMLQIDKVLVKILFIRKQWPRRNISITIPNKCVFFNYYSFVVGLCPFYALSQLEILVEMLSCVKEKKKSEGEGLH